MPTELGEDLVAYWEQQIVSSKEVETVGVLSHPRASASPTHTRSDRKKEKENRKRESRGVVEVARGRPI